MKPHPESNPTSALPWMETGTVSIRPAGTCNVLIVVPHGFPGNDDNTEILGAYLAELLDAWAVINNRKYRRPRKGELCDPDRCVLDLNKPRDARICRAEYWDPMWKAMEELCERFSKPPIVIFLHGIKDRTAREIVGRHIGSERALYAVGAGYAVDYSRTPPPISDAYELCHADGGTASVKFLADFMAHMRERVGPGGDGVPGYGATTTMPTIFGRSRVGRVEAIQLEVRWTGFRDTPANMKSAAEALAEVVSRVRAFEREWGTEPSRERTVGEKQ